MDRNKEQKAISIIGGAAGSGKTTLIEKCFDKFKFHQINTGSLFKSHMSLENRDYVRKGDWSVFEKNVTLDIIHLVDSFLQQDKKHIIIDTHFAAKIHGTKYRIGLKDNLIFSIGKVLFAQDYTYDGKLRINVILVTTDPYFLLQRRRLDKSRDRELIPSDCYNALRENEKCSVDYYSELSRAEKECFSKKINRVQYYVVENINFDDALRDLVKILEGE